MLFTECVFDLGFYAAILSLLCALISIRANPLRSVNQLHALFFLSLSYWQFVVMMIRVTKNLETWGPHVVFVGGTFYPLLFLLHDSIIRPYDSLGSRFKREGWFLLSIALIPITGAFFTMLAGAVSSLSGLTWVPRIMALLYIGWSFRRSVSNSAKTPDANRHEVLLFNYTSSIAFLLFFIFIAIRHPIGNRLISGLVICLTVYTLVYQWQDRVLDSKGTGKRATSLLSIGLLHIALLFGALSLAQTAWGDREPLPVWLLTLASLGINSVLFAFVHPLIAKRIDAYIMQSKDATRKELAVLTSKASTELEVLRVAERISSQVLGGLTVAARVFGTVTDNTASATNSQGGFRDLASAQLAQLHALARDGNFTPFSALRLLRGNILAQALDLLTKAKIGAVVRRSADGLDLTLFVGQRGGGSRSISVYEVEHLEELASIALANIVRIRAVNSSLRSQSHAVIGQVVSQFNHESRNQLDAIKLFLATLDEHGNRQNISTSHLRMIQDTCESLSHGYDTVLAMATGRAPDKLQPLSANAIVNRFIGFYRDTLTRSGIELIFIADDLDSEILADDLRLRHVLVNLAQNSIQAMTEVKVQRLLKVQVTTKGTLVHITLEDNGSGIPQEIFDHLFTTWATTKSYGTGLGLSTSKQWLTQMGGSITILTPRGNPGAIFVLTFPRFDRTVFPAIPEGAGPAWVV